MKAKKETKVIDMDPVLTKDEAYKELYLQLRTESENKIKGLNIKKGQRLTANGKAILMIPFLDELGLDSLEKISEEASKMANKTSNLPTKARAVVETLCITIASRYNYLLVKKNEVNETPEKDTIKE